MEEQRPEELEQVVQELVAWGGRNRDLSGASLWQPRLSQANLSGAAVTAEQLREAFALGGAIMPHRIVHE